MQALMFERNIRELFQLGDIVCYNNSQYCVEKVGKPVSQYGGGEPKTDLYLYLVSLQNNRDVELKISIKQKNAMFLENKISRQRFINLFGEKSNDIVSQIVQDMSPLLEERPYFFQKKTGRVAAGSYCLGYRLDIMNRKCGTLSDQLSLDSATKEEILTGFHLPKEKKNAVVNGEIVDDSGIANVIYEGSEVPVSKSYVLDHLCSIKEYAARHDFFYALKAVNYRSIEDKFERGRSLFVYYDYFLNQNKIKGVLNFSNPLSYKSSDVQQILYKLLQR